MNAEFIIESYCVLDYILNRNLKEHKTHQHSFC